MNGDVRSTRHTFSDPPESSPLNGPKRGKRWIRNAIGRVRRTLTTRPEPMDQPQPGPSQQGSLFRKYWIQPKEENVQVRDDEGPGPCSSGASSGPDHVHVEQLVSAVADNTINKNTRSQWVSNSGFYMKDALMIEMIERDFYYYENERERKEQEKQAEYDIHRKLQDEQRENDLSQKVERAAGTSAWVWRPP